MERQRRRIESEAMMGRTEHVLHPVILHLLCNGTCQRYWFLIASRRHRYTRRDRPRRDPALSWRVLVPATDWYTQSPWLDTSLWKFSRSMSPLSAGSWKTMQMARGLENNPYGRGLRLPASRATRMDCAIFRGTMTILDISSTRQYIPSTN